MKKIILVLCLMITLVSCDKIISFDKEKLENQSVKYAIAIINNKIDDIYKNSDNNFKKEVTKDELAKAIVSVLDEAGTYSGDYRIEKTEIVDNNYLVSLNLDYSIKNVLMTFAYNLQNEIVGLWLNYADEFKIKLEDNEELLIIDRINGYPLDGIYTKANKDKAKVVIMIQGSGQTDLNGSIGLTKPFKDIANELAKNGIASIRYNKRYYTYPELANENTTVEDEIIDDILYLIDMVHNLKGIDDSEIYLLGHSLGAMLIPSILSQRDDIKGAILMAGSPRNLVQIIKDQNTNLYEELTKTTSESLISIIDEQILKINEEITKILSLDENSDMDEMLLGASARYWYSLNQRTDLKYLDDLDEDIFIIQGSDDFQVFKDIDFKLYYELLKDNPKVIFKLYDGLNHLMMPSGNKKDSSEYNYENHVSLDVINDIAAFINNK